MTEQRAIAKLLDKRQPSVLNEQQKLFVLEYMTDLNATQAAIRAGYPPATAAKIGHRLMKQGTVTGDAVARALAARATRVGISADRVLREAAKIAFGDPRVLFRSDGSLRTPDEYDENDGAMIEGIKTRRIVEVGADGEMQQVEIQEVKLSPKMPAVTLLARHLGILNDKLDVNVTGNLAARMDEAFKRTGRFKAEDDTDADAIEGDFEEVSEHPALTPDQAEIARRLLGIQQLVANPPKEDDGTLDLDAMLR